MLHITNGDATVDKLRRTGLPGEFVAWQDALHEGPVPQAVAPHALADLRARAIDALGLADYATVIRAFCARDAALPALADHDELVLWFEHDLHDQLQLLQIIDRIGDQLVGQSRLSIICIDSYSGIDPFYGLGRLEPGALLALFLGRVPLSPTGRTIARGAWNAFRSPDRRQITALLVTDVGALPFLSAALRRHCEQFPAVGSGLSHTERQILEILADGMRDPLSLFAATQQREEAPFMGDQIFWSYLHRLLAASTPLVAVVGGEPLPSLARRIADGSAPPRHLVLTDAGRGLLEGTADAILLSGIDRLLGGVHLRGPDAPWRWDGRRGVFVASGVAR